MAGGRRISRGTTSKHNLVFPTVPTCADERSCFEMKHIRIPVMPRESYVVFEVIVCFHAILFMSLQFLHLYRTVWWLPQSFNSVGINFHMIDSSLVLFISAVLFRRVIYMILKYMLPNFSLRLLQSVLTVQLLFFIIFPCYRLWSERGSGIVYLFVPYCWYFYAFGVSVPSLWEIEELDNPTSVLQYHICSTEASATREEVEVMRLHFNTRLKKIIALASFITYYSAFIPWCFTQTYVHYDLWWVTQHLILSWLVIFSLLISRGFCPEFADSLHKVACHLGKWTRLRPNHIPSQMWTGDTIFPPGSIVKHQRELYKAEGLLNAASEPGNPLHQRFQILFSGSTFSKGLLGFHVALIIWGLIILARTTEWYQIISISCLITSTMYTFIRLLVNFLVLFKMYQAEEILFRHGH